MNGVRNWLLPITLGFAQLLYWPRDLVPQPDEYLGVLAVVVITVALGWRRRRPLIALAGVAAGLTAGLLTTPEDAILAMQTADLIAFYSVVVREPRRTWLITLAALCAWQAVLGVVLWSNAAEYTAEIGLLVVVYVLIAGCGVARRQWLAGRRAAAQALQQAQVAHQEAGAGERRRLSAELHDVSAHHLTSIVVTMNAARRLAKPELVADSLRMAADTGRDAQAELRRLLTDSAAPAQAPLSERLAELADAFSRLDQRVRLETPGLETLAEPVAELAHAIVREALTNTVRYAPGAGVRVRLFLTTTESDVEQLHIVVENDAAPGDSGGAARLGSGRGLGGLRRRAQLLGGTLDAGPTAQGGWQLAATMLTSARAPRRWVPGLFDIASAALLLGLPLGLALIPDETAPLDGRSWLWVGVVVPLHTLPLLYRRRAPWAVWAAVYATAGLWPVWIVVAGEPSFEARINVAIYAGCAEFVAVYTVGAHARYKWPSLLVVPATAAVLGMVAAVGATLSERDGFGSPAGYVLLFVVMATMVGVLAVVPWAVGFAVRLRRDRIVGREDGAVTAAVAAAETEARLERARLVAGLREQVLEQTDRVVTAAERGDPDEVLVAARTALAAMRELLSALDPPVSGQPPSTLAASA